METQTNYVLAILFFARKHIFQSGGSSTNRWFKCQNSCFGVSKPVFYHVLSS